MAFAIIGGLASKVMTIRGNMDRLLDFGGSYEFIWILGFVVDSNSDSYRLNSAPSPQTEEAQKKKIAPAKCWPTDGCKA